MTKQFTFSVRCIVFDNVGLPNEVAKALGAQNCAFTGWTALAIHAGSKLMIPYHPKYLEIACPDLSNAVNTAKELGLRIWFGKRWITLGWSYEKTKIALGEIRLFKEEITAERHICGLGVSLIEDAINHIIKFREHIRDLKLLNEYSNGKIIINITSINR